MEFTFLDVVKSEQCSVGSVFRLTGDMTLAPQDDGLLVFIWDPQVPIAFSLGLTFVATMTNFPLLSPYHLEIGKY